MHHLELTDEELTMAHVAVCELRDKLTLGVKHDSATVLLDLTETLVVKIELKLGLR